MASIYSTNINLNARILYLNYAISSVAQTTFKDSHVIYTVIHNYGNLYEKWNIFVAWPHLWLKLCMVKPEIMLCETVLNLSTLRYVTAQYLVM